MKRYQVYPFIFILIFCSCSFTKNVKDGESAFERKQYATAIPMLQEEFDQSSNKRDRARKAFQLGISYQKINENELAIPWYEEAVNHQYGAEALKNLARAHKQNENYSQAINYFQQWGKEGGQQDEVQREIALCEMILESKLFQTKAKFVVEPLDDNSPYAEYAPCMYDRNYIVFTADRESATGEEIYKWTNSDFSDLFIKQKTGGDAQLFDDFLNTEHNEGAACFNQDFSEIFFTRCYGTSSEDQFCKILWSAREGTGWSEPIIPFYMESDVNYGHPTLVENDSVMIFTSDHISGKGAYDLYYSVKMEDGWSLPDLMPDYLNSVGNEMFPRSDGDTLYYSSDYLPGLGGLDIFKTFLKADGRWQVPENLGRPVNSGGDDFSLVIDHHARKRPNVISEGYFSSSREGEGNDDLYHFKMLVPDKETEELITEELTEEDDSAKKIHLFLAGKVVEKRFAEEGNPNSEVIGKNPLNRSLVELSDASAKPWITNADGLFVVELEKDLDYVFKASKPGYLTNEIQFSTRDLNLEEAEEDLTFNVEIILDKIYVDKEIVLDNIYYDFDKWNIREDAKPVLDEFAKILAANPDINIQLSSHTDCRGTNEYNQDLSQKRAQSVVDYLISVGIIANRLTAIGYGESLPESNCICGNCTEEQHQANRRTTFKILE